MKTKFKDQLYCGINPNKIKNINPVLNNDNLQIFWEFLSERHNIFLKKEVYKLPKPWSNSIIFQNVKFTNIFREYDRESKLLINNIANKYEYSLKDRIFNIMLSRYWNKHQSWIYATNGEIINFPITENKKQELINNIKNIDNYNFYTSAYYTTSARHHMKKYYQHLVDKKEAEFCQAPIYALYREATDDYFNKLINSKNQLEVYKILRGIHGVGDFVAYQWFVDFTYMEDFPFSENEFTIAGPGCRNGINLLFEDKKDLSYEECLFYIRDFQDEILGPLGYTRSMFIERNEEDKLLNIMSIENIFCEFYKYMKCKNQLNNGETVRGKNRYNGKSNISTELSLYSCFDG